jgi:hypothetical protein
VALALLAALQIAHASTVGVTNGTLLGGGGGADTGLRDRIELQVAGDLLAGRASNTVVRRIVLSAPGATGGQIIVREVPLPDGRRSLHIAAAPDLVTRTQRATVYLDLPPGDWVVAETAEHGLPVQHTPHRVAAEDGVGGAKAAAELHAVVLRRLGPIWVMPGPSASATSGANDHSARTLLGAGAWTAWLPVIAALALLALARSASRWAHRKDGRVL